MRRHTWMALWAGLSVVASGCEGDGILPPPRVAEDGAIRIETVTANAVDGAMNTLRLDEDDLGVIGPNDFMRLGAVAVGNHSIELKGLPDGCLKGENPRAVTVRAGIQAVVTFEIKCA